MTDKSDQQDGGTASMPKTIEEYLAYANLKDWPLPLQQGDYGVQITPDRIVNKDLLVAKLLQAAPLTVAGFGVLRDEINLLQNRVADLAGHFIMEKAVVPASQSKRTFYAPPTTFLTEIAESEIVQCLAGVKKGKVIQADSTDEVATFGEERCFNVLKAHFPGFKPDGATDLPNWLELPGIVEKVAQTIGIQDALRAMWRQIYLSQASIVLMQDGFWWLFLDYFKRADEEALEARDKIFDRMADTFVTLFFSVDRSVRDKFFQDYSTIVSQALFLCFADAFPDSQYLYDDTFKRYLADSISLWLHGVKAVPEIYKTWAVNSMLKADRIEAERKKRQENMVFDPQTLDDALTQLAPINPYGRKSVVISNSVTQLATPPLQPLSKLRESHPRAVSLTGVPGRAAKGRVPPVRESHPIGPSAQIERVRFRLTGNSLLMDHHMRMHGLPIVTGPLAVRSQEVARPHMAAKTYADLIKESRKAMKDLQKNLNDMEQNTHEEIAKLRKQYFEDRRNGFNKVEGRSVDTTKVAQMEVREMMKNALKAQETGRPGDDEELAMTLSL